MYEGGYGYKDTFVNNAAAADSDNGSGDGQDEDDDYNGVSNISNKSASPLVVTYFLRYLASH